MKGTPLERLLQQVNRLVTPLVRWGLPMGSRNTPMALLTVRGRKSGLPRTVPVALAPVADGWILISVYGVSDWSRNLDAAGRATVTQRGSATDVVVERVVGPIAASILRDAITGAPWLIRKMTAKYYQAGGDSPIEEWVREAEQHPVFRLTPSVLRDRSRAAM